MPTTIANVSKERVSRLIRNDFDEIPNQPWREDDLFETIQSAYYFGLNELGNELELELEPDQRRRFLNLKEKENAQ